MKWSTARYVLPLQNQAEDVPVRVFFRDTHPQNHRVVEAERDLQRSSATIPLLNKGHLELTAQDHVQSGFEYLQGARLYPLCAACASSWSHSQ